jgi:5'-nucleotidase
VDTVPTVLALLTNDDGIDAPGLIALERAFAARADVEVWTAAPDGERSASSHGMSLDRPLFAREVGERRIALSGLPADCVYFALFGWLPRRPDVVVAGINRGPNLGSDVIYSGTVAGAREAVVRGVHGLAASLVSGDEFDAVAPRTVELALELAGTDDSRPRLLNLNFPGPRFTGPELAPLGGRVYPELVERRVIPISGRAYHWLGGPPVRDRLVEGSDGWLIDRGIAALTPLALDQTDHQVLERMAARGRSDTEEDR